MTTPNIKKIIQIFDNSDVILVVGNINIHIKHRYGICGRRGHYITEYNISLKLNILHNKSFSFYFEFPKQEHFMDISLYNRVLNKIYGDHNVASDLKLDDSFYEEINEYILNIFYNNTKINLQEMRENISRKFVDHCIEQCNVIMRKNIHRGR